MWGFFLSYILHLNLSKASSRSDQVVFASGIFLCQLSQIPQNTMPLLSKLFKMVNMLSPCVMLSSDNLSNFQPHSQNNLFVVYVWNLYTTVYYTVCKCDLQRTDTVIYLGINSNCKFGSCLFIFSTR